MNDANTLLSRLVDVIVARALPEKGVLEQEVLKQLKGIHPDEVFQSFLQLSDKIDTYGEDYEERESSVITFQPVKIGYGYLEGSYYHGLEQTEKLIDLGDAFPWPLQLSTKPETYVSCQRCSRQAPLLLIERSYDNWRKDHLIAFSWHCANLSIVYNLICEFPFP